MTTHDPDLARLLERAPAKADQPRKGNVQERPPNVAARDGKRVLGLAALLFGVPLWIVGAHYTLDGWTLMMNVVFDLVRSDVRLPLATGVWSLLLVPMGIVYSIGERRYLPIRKPGKSWIFLGWGVLLVWAIVNSTDLGSTYLGIANPPADAWPITKWMAATLWAKMAWIVVVTYVPEVLLMLGWRWLTGK